MQVLPDTLVELLKNRQAVLVTGMGCAELAQMPSWIVLGERLAGRVEDELVSATVRALLQQDRTGSAMALLRATLHEQVLAEVIGEAYPLSAPVPEPIKAVAGAAWRGLINTGLDALWAAAVADQPDLANRVVFAPNASSLGPGRGRFVLQLFGRPDIPASLCLAPAEVTAKIVSNGASTFVTGLHEKLSFVFVGYRPNDPDLAMLVQRVLGASSSTRQHFFVSPSLSEVDAALVRAELGLIPVSLAETLETTLTTLAELCGQGTGQPAEDDVEGWLEVCAGSDEPEARAALERGLARLREKQEWERLAAALLSRAEQVHEPAAQAAALHEVGLLLDREMSAPERAYPVLATALHLEPRNRELLADVKRVAEKAGQWSEFVQEIGQIEREAEDADNSTQIALNMGRLCADDPGRLDHAISSYQKALDRDPQNPEILKDLEALYRKAERWEPLRALFEKMLARDPDDTTTLAKLRELLRETGQTEALIDLLCKLLARNPADTATLLELEALYRRTEQWGPLVDLFERLTDREPNNSEALAKLEVLYRQTEHWKALCDLLERRAQKKSDPEQARGLRMDRANLLLEKLGDVESALVVAQSFAREDAALAEELYSKTLTRSPGNAASLVALADIYLHKGEFQRALKFALDAAERIEHPIEKARLLTEAAVLMLDRLDNAERGFELLSAALEADPEQPVAGERLARIYEDRQDWAALEPLLDTLLRRASNGSNPNRADLHERLARCAKQLGKLDKALANYQAAAALASYPLPIVQAIAELQFEREDWSEACKAYEEARVLAETTLSAHERALLAVRMATCASKLDDSGLAVSCYLDALALEPDKRSHIEALVEIHSGRGEWQEVANLQRKLVAQASDDKEKANLWDGLGDLYRDRLSDETEAAAAFLKALDLQPDRRSTLYKILEHYETTKDWTRAIETLEKLAELETSPELRAKCRYALAVIHRDEVHDEPKALAVFAQVLDDNPMQTKAFDAIERMLTASKNWKELARAYRRQIKRLAPEAPAELKLRLWDSLAKVAWEQLHNRDSAILALEVAKSIDSNDLPRMELLADLYHDAGPVAAPKEIEQHQLLISKKPDRVASYQALAGLFYQAGAHDKLWCVAGALTYLGKADAPMRAYFENYRPTQVLHSLPKMTEEMWSKAAHPGEDLLLSGLLSVLSPAIGLATASTHKDIGVDRSERVNLFGAHWNHAPALRFVANTIEASLPDVFLRPDAESSVSIANLKDRNTLTPALVIGTAFDWWTRQSEVIFDLAKRMVLLRPDRLARSLLGTPEALTLAVRAGLLLGGCPVGENGADVEQAARSYEGLLSGPARADLKAAAKRLVDERGDRIDVSAWFTSSDLSAARAALVLCGDIAAASRVLASEPATQSPLPFDERLKDLLAFSVSESHFELRAALGMGVDLNPRRPEGPSGPHRTSHAQIKTTA